MPTCCQPHRADTLNRSGLLLAVLVPLAHAGPARNAGDRVGGHGRRFIDAEPQVRVVIGGQLEDVVTIGSRGEPTVELGGAVVAEIGQSLEEVGDNPVEAWNGGNFWVVHGAVDG